MGGLAATGRRIGLAAVCAAIIAPMLVPGLTLHQLFGGHGNGGGGAWRETAKELFEGEDDAEAKKETKREYAAGLTGDAMKPIKRRFLAIILGSIVAAAPAFAGDQPSGEDFVAVFNKIYGAHEGFRANHAKGIMAEGTFTPTKKAKSLYPSRKASQLNPIEALRYE